MDEDWIQILTEKYENGQTGEVVDGVTIMIDGKFKQVLDVLLQKEGSGKSYTEIMCDVLVEGVNGLIGKYRP